MIFNEVKIAHNNRFQTTRCHMLEANRYAASNRSTETAFGVRPFRRTGK